MEIEQRAGGNGIITGDEDSKVRTMGAGLRCLCRQPPGCSPSDGWQIDAVRTGRTQAISGPAAEVAGDLARSAFLILGSQCMEDHGQQ